MVYSFSRLVDYRKMSCSFPFCRFVVLMVLKEMSLFFQDVQQLTKCRRLRTITNKSLEKFHFSQRTTLKTRKEFTQTHAKCTKRKTDFIRTHAAHTNWKSGCWYALCSLVLFVHAPTRRIMPSSFLGSKSVSCVRNAYVIVYVAIVYVLARHSYLNKVHDMISVKWGLVLEKKMKVWRKYETNKIPIHCGNKNVIGRNDDFMLSTSIKEVIIIYSKGKRYK